MVQTYSTRSRHCIKEKRWWGVKTITTRERRERGREGYLSGDGIQVELDIRVCPGHVDLDLVENGVVHIGIIPLGILGAKVLLNTIEVLPPLPVHRGLSPVLVQGQVAHEQLPGPRAERIWDPTPAELAQLICQRKEGWGSSPRFRGERERDRVVYQGPHWSPGTVS